jgi:P-type conjugative transfer protein TrbJ
MSRISYLAAVGTVVLTVGLAPPPSPAQTTVFDPNNYAQNVLTTARALQQINNQITSLQNQAQMLINQAKNLANLPFSSFDYGHSLRSARPDHGAGHRKCLR